MNWVYVNVNRIIGFEDIATKYLSDTMIQRVDNSETSLYILSTRDDQRSSLRSRIAAL